jgi:hypothetical protein
MPPIGVSCQEVNGVCQITPLTPITTTTIPPVSTTIVPGCTDSDGGNNIYIKGTTTGPDAYGGNTSRIATYTDSCDGTSRVLEFYCNTTNSKSPYVTANNIACPSGYTCQDGACKPATTASITIISPNGGEKFSTGQTIPISFVTTLTDKQTSGITLQLYKKTTDSFGKMYVQDIVRNWIYGSPYQWTIPNTIAPGEYFIYATAENLNDVSVKEVYDFSDAPFSIISSICTDSDGGKNYYVKGTVTYNGQTYTDSCEDCETTCPNCAPPCNYKCETFCSAVKEYYCENGVMKQETHVCESGSTCQDGACKPATTSLSVDLKVNNSDGPITVPFNSILNVSWNSTGATTCIPLGPFMPLVKGGIWAPSNYSSFPLSGTEQIYAQHLGLPQDTVLDIGISCSKAGYSDVYDHVIVNLTSIPNPPTCTDSDGGNNPYVKGTVMYNNQMYTDTCSDPNTLIEYSCGNGQIQKVVYPCEPNFTCQDGACKPINTSLKAYISGVTTLEVSQSGTFSVFATGGIPPYYYEWSSNGNIYTGGTTATYKWDEEGIYTISVKVTDSQKLTYTASIQVSVIRSTRPICTDSDGGKNYYVKGTVTYNGQTYTDSCTYCTGVAPYSVTCGAVVEYYCENGVMKQETHVCENGYTCQDGACQPTVATTIPPVVTTIPSYGKCTDGSICGWCGDKCTKITAGMDCPQVAPPPGTNCACINNTCVVQYSSSTLMDTLNKLTASLMSLMELLKH